MNELILIGAIAFITSVISGMLGLGGAVILIPAYLYLPNLFGITPLDIKLISGMTSVQVFAVSLLGTIFHGRKGVVHKKLVFAMGIPITLSAFFGAALSKIIHPDYIIGLFAFMAVLGAVLIIIKKDNQSDIKAGDVSFNTWAAVIIAALVGFLGGIVGAPGAFILAPLMLTVLNIPMRITIGSTLGIVLLSALAASSGKLVTSQVPYAETLTAVIASIPGIYLGTHFSHQIKIKSLRWALAFIIAFVGIEMWIQIFF